MDSEALKSFLLGALIIVVTVILFCLAFTLLTKSL